MITPSTPTTADVEHVCAVSDPVIRNLQITQCYHELALALAGRSGWDANWCTFATWASKQAGQTIRKEDLARALENHLRGEETAMLVSSAQQSGVKLGKSRDWPARADPPAARDQRGAGRPDRRSQGAGAQAEQGTPPGPRLAE